MNLFYFLIFHKIQCFSIANFSSRLFFKENMCFQNILGLVGLFLGRHIGILTLLNDIKIKKSKFESLSVSLFMCKWSDNIKILKY